MKCGGGVDNAVSAWWIGETGEGRGGAEWELWASVSSVILVCVPRDRIESF